MKVNRIGLATHRVHGFAINGPGFCFSIRPLRNDCARAGTRIRLPEHRSQSIGGTRAAHERGWPIRSGARGIVDGSRLQGRPDYGRYLRRPCSPVRRQRHTNQPCAHSNHSRNPGRQCDAVAIDTQGNLYVGFATADPLAVVKIPYVSGAYAAIGAAASQTQPYPAGTPNCTGTDTVECVMSNLNTKASGVSGLVFDSKGDLFYSTTNIGDNGAATAPNSIWECTAACLYTGTPAATLLFTEPTSATPVTTGQLNVGGLAIDPYGDLFFSDSAISSGTNAQESFTSNLNELVYSGTAFATSPPFSTAIRLHRPLTMTTRLMASLPMPAVQSTPSLQERPGC